jgi:hypothetical protein
VAAGDPVPTAGAASLSGASDANASGSGGSGAGTLRKARLLGGLVLGEVPPDCAWQGVAM